MPVPEIVLSPGGVQDCPCEKTVTFLCSGSASGLNLGNVELDARAQMNDAIIDMEKFITKWVSRLSCRGSCRLIEFEIERPKGDLHTPIEIVRNKNDGSIIRGLKHLLFGEGEVLYWLCSWTVTARHGVLCIPADKEAGG